MTLNTTTQKTSTTSNCAVYEAPDIEGQTQVLTGLYIDGAAFGSVEDAPDYLDVTIGSDENVPLEPDGESANFYQFASPNGVIRGSYVSKDEMESSSLLTPCSQPKSRSSSSTTRTTLRHSKKDEAVNRPLRERTITRTSRETRKTQSRFRPMIR